MPLFVSVYVFLLTSKSSVSFVSIKPT